ncbi:MAG: MFS transporter [Elusimicrobia bacterium]|nr:MFS transporter [Elusimicrobiota bacterium]
MTIVLPLLPFYAEHYGASPHVVGLLLATYPLCQLVAGPILGSLSDRHGRRPLLLISQLGTFAGFLLLGAANSLPLIFASRFLDGMTAGNLSLAQAYISDVTQPAERAHSFAIIGIAFGVGFLFGPALSGYLSQFSYSYPAWAAAALSLTSIVCTYFLLPQAAPHPQDADAGPAGRRLGLADWGAYGEYFRRPELGRLLADFFVFSLMFGLFLSGFALFAERRFTIDGRPFGPKEVGYLYAYSGFLGLIIQGGLLKRLVKRFGERSLMLAGYASAALGLVGLAAARPLGALIAVFTVTAFGNSVLRPCLTSTVSFRAGRSEQGLVLGLTQSLYSVAMIVSPLVSGFLIGEGRLSAWALCGAALAAGGYALSRNAPSPALSA